MARRGVSRSVGQKGQSMIEAIQDRGDRQDLDSCGRQLDRQRQAVEPPAQLANLGCVLIIQPEFRLDGDGASDEEFNGVGAGDGITAGRRGGSSSGARAYSCSPEMRIGVRLVTRIRIVGASVRSAPTSVAASTMCSKLSSTSSTWRVSRCVLSASSGPRSPEDWQPSTSAAVVSINRGSVMGASSTNHTPSAKPSRRRSPNRSPGGSCPHPGVPSP